MTTRPLSRPLDDHDLAWVAALGAVTACALIYMCTMTFGFVFDDHLVLPNVPDWSWRDRYLLTTGTFYWSTQPAAQHAINLSLHLLNGCLAYTLLARWGVRPAARACAIFIWLLHPLQIETVAYVSGGRSDLLIALGLLIALHGVEDAPRYPLRWGHRWTRDLAALGLIATGIALMVLAKPAGIAALLPLWFVAMARNESNFRWLRWPVWLATVWVTTNYVIIRDALSLHGWEYQSRAALQLAAVGRWLGMVALPWGQTADWNVGAWQGLVEVRVIALLIVAIWAWRADVRLRALVAWLAVTLGWRVLIPSSEWLNEGDGYLALLGVATAIGIGADWLFTHEVTERATDYTY